MAKAPYRFTVLAVVAAIALATLAVWSVRLVVDVGELRSNVETRVSWLSQIAAAQHALDDEIVDADWAIHAERLRKIAANASETSGPEALTLPAAGDARADLRRDLGVMVAEIRTETSRLSAELGEHWDSINLLVVVSLFFATSTLGLLVYVRLIAQPTESRSAVPLQLATNQLTDRLATVGTLATGVAHEVNNPLTYVTTNLQLLREDLVELDGSQAMMPLVDDALQGAKRVGEIVHGLDRLRTIPVNPASTANLDEVLDDALANQPGLAGVAVRRRGPRLPPVSADAPILTEVFRNIIDNAAHAMREIYHPAHRLQIVTETLPDERVRVSISDTGAGIDPRIQDRIFEPFFTTRDVGDGTGLGLYVCHAIVGSLGGTIDVESSPEGTTISVLLPLSCEKPALQSA